MSEASGQLAALIERAKAGEDVVLSDGGIGQVRLVPVPTDEPSQDELVAKRRQAAKAVLELRATLRPDQFSSTEQLISDKNFGRR